jgi:hypothetical protein
MILRLDTEGLPAGPATARIVDAQGRLIAELPVQLAAGRLETRWERGLEPGGYWVRLYAGTELLREYALRVRTP